MITEGSNAVCGLAVVGVVISQCLSLTQVIIEHGALIAGILSKDTLGNKTGSLMHVIAAEFGYDVARDFYGNIQKVVNNFLMIEGHSIGIGDTIADTDTYNDIQRTIRQAKVGLGVEEGTFDRPWVDLGQVESESAQFNSLLLGFDHIMSVSRPSFLTVLPPPSPLNLALLGIFLLAM